MAKAFSQSNKENIKRILLDKGREYFIKYGLKKTSVDELAKAAGIAKGSFYKFFDSKEALFLAVHEESESKLQRNIMHKLDEVREPSGMLRLFFKSSFLVLNEDPLLKAVFGKGEIENLSGFMTSEQYREHYKHDTKFISELVRKWQNDGIIRKLDPDVVTQMIISSFYIILQKDNMPEEMYNSVTDMLVDCLTNYLVNRNNECK